MQRSQRHHFPQKRLGFTVLLLCFLGLAGVLAGQEIASTTAPAEDTSLKAKAEQKISELRGVPVSVQDYKLDYTTVRLHGITIGDRNQPRLPFAEVQDLSATCNVMSLLTGTLVLEEITLASLSGRLTRDPSGAFVLGSFPVPASGAAVLEPEAFPFQKIHGTNIGLQLLDEGLHKTVGLRISTLEVEKPAGGKVVDVKVAGALSLSTGEKAAKLPECPFHGTFQAEGFSPFLASGSAALGPTPARDLQTILEGVLPGSAGKIQFQAGTAEAGLDFSSLAQASPDTKAWARLRGVSLQSPSSKLRAQDVSGDVSFAGTWKAGVLNGSLTVAKLHGTVGDGKVPIGLEALRGKVDNFGKGSGMLQIEETDLTILGTALRVSGTLKPADTPPLRLAVNSTLDLTLLQKNLPGTYDWFRKGTTLSGKATVAAEIIGSLQDPEAKAEIRLSDGAFAWPEKKVQVKKLDITMRADARTATLSDLKAVTAGGKLAMNGTVKDLADPTLALSGTLGKADSGEVLAILRTLFPTIPKDLKCSGDTDIEFILDGKAAKPRIQGAAAFQNAGMELPVLMRPFSQIKGTVQFDNNSLRTDDLRMKWGTSDVRISGQVKDLTAFQTGLSFTVKPLDLTDMATFFLAARGYQVRGSGEAEGTISGPPAGLKIEGGAKIPSGQIVAPISASNKSAYAFPFQNLSTRFRFSGGILSINEARASVFGGTLTGNGSVHPRQAPVRFELNATGEGLQTEAFLAENTSQKQVISGPINGNLQAKGDITGLSSWNGKGSVNMKSGKYQAPPVVTPILSALNLSQFASGDLTGINGTFALKNGVMTTTDLAFQSTVGKAFYRGDVGLDTTLNGDLSLVFAQVAVAQSQVLQQISLDGTSVSIPTKVRGTLLAPLFPGFSPGKLVELGLKRTGQKMLQDALLGKSRNTETGTASASGKIDPGKELLRGLEGLFNRKKKSTPAPTTSEPPKEDSSSEKELQKNIGKELQKLFKF